MSEEKSVAQKELDTVEEAPVIVREIASKELQISPTGSIRELEQSVAKAEKYFEVLDRVRKLAIKVTNVSDWINQDGNPYLQASGSFKIAGAFGIKITEPSFSREEYSDDKGEYYIFTVNFIGHWRDQEITQTGTCSTRDSFFGTKSGNVLPLSEINVSNIKKKAYTNGLQRLIKSLLGLSFTWDEIAEYSSGKITKETVTGISRNKGGRGGRDESPQAGGKRSELGKILMFLSDGDKEVAKKKLADYTTFKGRDGKMIAGKTELAKCSEKQLDIVLEKARKDQKTYADEIAARTAK